MDVEKEIHTLTAETLALMAIFARVIGNLADSSAEMHAAIAGGFDDAAGMVEHLVIALGKESPPSRGVRALEIVEILRTASLGDQNQPKHTV
jgi:hypothetical protein